MINQAQRSNSNVKLMLTKIIIRLKIIEDRSDIIVNT